MSSAPSQPATKADIEDLRQHLFGTWKAIGHVLAATHGQEEACRLVATANVSAKADEHAAVYQLIEVALEYIGKGAQSGRS
nr:hypothetical protein [Pseudomonas sp.]